MDVTPGFMISGFHLVIQESAVGGRRVALISPKGGAHAVTELSQLRGAVRLSTPEEALAFVRLRTQWSHDGLGPLTLEVHAVHPLSAGSESADGLMGGVARADLIHQLAKYPKITKRGQTYVIRRMVVTFGGRSSFQGGGKIQGISESVLPDGNYAVSNDKAITLGPLTKVKWWFVPRK